MKLNRNIIDALLLDSVLDSQGIYPQAMIDAKGVRTERTPWQDGWNDFHIQLIEKACIASAWFDKLSIQEVEDFYELLLNEVIRLSVRGGAVKLWLQMNDTFNFACADSEDVEIKDLVTILYLWQKYGYEGLIAWAANKRHEAPLNSIITKTYLLALKEAERLTRDDQEFCESDKRD